MFHVTLDDGNIRIGWFYCCFNFWHSAWRIGW